MPTNSAKRMSLEVNPRHNVSASLALLRSERCQRVKLTKSAARQTTTSHCHSGEFTSKNVSWMAAPTGPHVGGALAMYCDPRTPENTVPNKMKIKSRFNIQLEMQNHSPGPFFTEVFMNFVAFYTVVGSAVYLGRRGLAVIIRVRLCEPTRAFL